MATATLTLGSQNRWLADGATAVWNINFVGGYLSQDTVHAYSYLTDESIRVDHTLTFLSEFQIRTTPTPAAGYTLVVYRDSNNGGLPRADFVDGGGITESNLDLLAKQAVFSSQETRDFLGVSSEGTLATTLVAVQTAASNAGVSAGASAVSALAADASADAAAVSAVSAAASAAQAALDSVIVIDAVATLHSTAVGEGASTLGSSDVGNYFTSANTEGQLQEVGYKWQNGFTLGSSLVKLVPGAFSSFLAFQAVNNNDTARLYLMPRGKVSGVPSAIKVFMDDYNAEVVAGTANYRDCGIYGDTAIKGINGAGSWLINSKSNGNYFAHMPQIGISRSDGNEINFRVATTYVGATEAQMATYAANYIGQWTPSTVVAAGATCSYGLLSYSTVAGGTTGTTAPTHTGAPTSDGGVTWTYLWDNSTGGTGVDLRQWVIIGNKDDVPVWTGSTRVKDAPLHITRDAVQYPQKRLIYTRALGEITALVGTKSSSDYNWYVYDKTDAFGLRINFDAASPFVQHVGLAESIGTKTVSTVTAVPDCGGAKKIIFNAPSANPVTGFGNQPTHGFLLVSSGNGFTSLVHSAAPGTAGSPTIYLNTGANKTLSDKSLLMFSLNSSATQWIEVGSL